VIFLGKNRQVSSKELIVVRVIPNEKNKSSKTLFIKSVSPLFISVISSNLCQYFLKVYIPNYQRAICLQMYILF